MSDFPLNYQTINVTRESEYERQRRLRKIDLEILWPICKEKAIDLDHAKAAFAYHAFHDRAWWDIRETEMIDIINGLK